MKRFFVFVILMGAAFCGYWFAKEPSFFSKVKEFPLVEEKKFAVVIHASNDALWCKRTLRSIFEQEHEAYRVFFIDDGSEDDTYEIASSFITVNHQESRSILLRNETPLGPLASLQRAITHLLDSEIVIPLSAKDWLATPTVLSRLNAVYQNPDVWLTTSPSIAYPSYEKMTACSAYSFYAELFRKKSLDGTKPLSFTTLAEGHIYPCKEPLIFANYSLMRRGHSFGER